MEKKRFQRSHPSRLSFAELASILHEWSTEQSLSEYMLDSEVENASIEITSPA